MESGYALVGSWRLGEDLVDGVRREIKEETGLDVETSGKAVVFDRIVKEHSRTKLHVIYIDFIAKVVGGELKASSDVGLARWFSREELQERWGELHEDTQRLLKEAGVVEKDASIIA